MQQLMSHLSESVGQIKIRQSLASPSLGTVGSPCSSLQSFRPGKLMAGPKDVGGDVD